jgi:hypothetical protein
MIDGFPDVANSPLPDVGATQEVDDVRAAPGERKRCGDMIVKSAATSSTVTSTGYGKQPSGLDDTLRKLGSWSN